MKDSNLLLKVTQCVDLLLTPLILTLLLVIPALSKAQETDVFAPPVSDPFGLGYHSAEPSIVYVYTFADLDADNDPDLIVTRELREFPYTTRDALYFHENIGTSSRPVFSSASTETFGIPDDAVSEFHFIDIDNDGDLDLFARGSFVLGSGRKLVYVENTGDASSADFSGKDPLVNPFNLEQVSLDISFGDMDADGDYDVFHFQFLSSHFSYQENIGTPEAPVYGSLEADPFGLRVIDQAYAPLAYPMDMDCDGDLDILTSGLAYHENSGTPSEPYFAPIHVRIVGDTYPTAFVDIDGDGDLDMWHNEDFYQNIWGCGSFFRKSLEWQDASFIQLPAPEAGDLRLYEMADMDHDGDKDLFVLTLNYINDPCFTDQAKSLLYFENISSPDAEGCLEFAEPLEFPFGIPPTVKHLRFVDIDGDEDLDLFTIVWCAREIQFIENTGTPEMPVFSKNPMIANPFGIDPNGVDFASPVPSFADMDDDGDYDLLIGGRTGNHIQYQENIGTATDPLFASKVADPFGLELPFDPKGPVLMNQVDHDCDGDPDLFLTMWSIDLASDSMDLFYYENTGTPEVPVFSTHLATGDHFFAHAFTDMDGDGDQDVFAEKIYRNTRKSPCVQWPEAVIDYGLMHERTWWFSALQSQYAFSQCYAPDFIWNFGLNGLEEHAVITEHTFPAEGLHTVCLTVEDYVGNDVQCIDLLITGTREFLQLSKLVVYPNPALSSINVILDNDLESAMLTVFDSQGRSVYSCRLPNYADDPGVEIPVYGLAPGIYAVSITNQNTRYIGQFVVASR